MGSTSRVRISVSTSLSDRTCDVKPRARRVIKRTALGLAASLIVLAVILLFTTTTTAGARITLRMLAARFPVKLEFEDLHGSLRGPLSLEGISGGTSTFDFRIDRMTFDLRLFELVKGRVHLDSIQVVGARATLMRDTVAAGESTRSTDTLQIAASEERRFELPVALVFDRVVLDDASVSVSGDINVSDIHLTASGTDVDYRTEATATISAADLGQAWIEASGGGDSHELRLDQFHAMVLDGEVRGSGRLSWQPGVEWQAALEADSLTPSTLVSKPEDWPGWVSLRAAIDGRLVDGRREMDVRIDTVYGTLRGRPLTGVVKSTIKGSEYSLDQVDIDWGPARIDAAGVMNGDLLDLGFDLRVPNLAIILPRSSGSVYARGRLAGSPSTPVINATAMASSVVLGELRLRHANARVDVDWLNRSRNEVNVTIEDAEYSDQIIDSVRLVVRGSRESHRVEATVASSRADINLAASGGITDWTWSGVLADLGIHTPRAGDWQLQRAASLTASKTTVKLDDLCLLATEGEFCIDGTWGSQPGWQVQSSMSQLPFSLIRPLLPDALTIDGTVSGRVSAAGNSRNPESLQVDLRSSSGYLAHTVRDTVTALEYREAHVTISALGDSLNGSLSAQLAEANSTDFGSLSAELNLSSFAELIDRISTDSIASVLPREWTLKSSLDQMSLSLLRPLLPSGWSAEGTVAGTLNAAGHAGVPEYMELDLRPSPGTIQYALRDTTMDVRYSEVHATVSANSDSVRGDLQLKLASGGSAEFGDVSIGLVLPSLADVITEVRTEGLMVALQDEWKLNCSTDQVPLGIFDALLPAGATLAGSLDGTLEASAAPDGAISGRLELNPRSARSQRSFGGNVHTIRMIDTQIKAQAGPEGVQGEATVAVARANGPEQGTVTASITLPELTRLGQPLKSQPLTARVESRIDVSLLDELFDDFSGSTGQLEVDLTAGNTISDIDVAGHYRLRGQTDVLSLGIDLRDIDIRASDDPDGNLQIAGSVSSGNGQLTIAGTSPAIPTPESPARLTIRGENFQAMRTDQLNVVVSPDIDVTIGGHAIKVSGEVTVPRAVIEILEVPYTAVRVSPDVVYVGETETTETAPLDVTADVTLTLGENVVFRGFGFNTHLDGTVVATDRPAQVTQGRGELVLREGIYRGYGQNLSIDPGRLIFAGPIDDPGVDVRAYRRATDGTNAGFLVGGTLKSPTVEIWSDPAKTDSDALSYILFGRSMSQGTESDQAQAGEAAAVLGGNMLAMSMASKIGLDEARIETGTRQQETAFYAGKYLSPKLYVAYGVGLYEPINVLRVRYLLSRKFTLQAETGTRDSGDILYRIEF
jgi:autotransporter translocation and assembly factor TamB